jgi:hypothetical protein
MNGDATFQDNFLFSCSLFVSIGSGKMNEFFSSFFFLFQTSIFLNLLFFLNAAFAANVLNKHMEVSR